MDGIYRILKWVTSTIAVVVFCCLGFTSQAVVNEEALFPPAANAAQDTEDDEKDTSLSTYQAAVECATAQLIEQHKPFSNPRDAAFKTGLCTGKIQTYMLGARAQNPDCFPKLSLEEGIDIFVKWEEAHTEQGATDYPDGIRMAFEDFLPCLAKGRAASAGDAR